MGLWPFTATSLAQLGQVIPSQHIGMPTSSPIVSSQRHCPYAVQILYRVNCKIENKRQSERILCDFDKFRAESKKLELFLYW
jgi:hypothetical protein